MVLLHKSIRRLAILLPLTVASSLASAGFTFVNGSSLNVNSNDQAISGTDNQSLFTPSFGPPASGTLTAADGDASSSVDYTFSESLWNFDLSLQTAGNPNGGDGNNGFSASLRFNVDTETNYAFDSFLGSSNSVGSGSASLFVFLQDLSNNNVLLNSDQQETIIDETFYIEADGNPGGDNVSTFSGSLTGTLLTGRDYRLSVSMANSMSHTTQSGALAGGNASFALSPVNAPAPAGLGLMLSALVGFLVARNRR